MEDLIGNGILAGGRGCVVVFRDGDLLGYAVGRGVMDGVGGPIRDYEGDARDIGNKDVGGGRSGGCGFRSDASDVVDHQ